MTEHKPGREIAVPDVIEGVVSEEDRLRTGLRAAGLPVVSAAETRRAAEETDAMVRDFITASREEDGRCPECGSGIRGERLFVPGFTGEPVDCGGDWHEEDER